MKSFPVCPFNIGTLREGSQVNRWNRLYDQITRLTGPARASRAQFSSLVPFLTNLVFSSTMF